MSSLTVSYRTMRGVAGIAVVLMFAQLCPGAAFAAGQDCMARYYRAKSPACVDSTLAQVREMAANSKGDPNTVIGFLAILFRTSPSERERLLRSEPSDYVKSVKLVSLYRAGLTDDAQKFAAANNLSALSDKLRTAPTAPLDAVKPSANPGDNDLLIGAYMASGDTVLVRRILDNYSTADDGMVSDGPRIGFMMSKFGPGLAPQGRESVILKVACAKYECKTDRAKMLRVMTLATAIWSLQSLSAQDDGIKKTLSDFFSRDARLAALYDTEQAAFANYMTAIIAAAAFQDDSGTDKTSGAMSKAASIYENLGSAKDAFEPFENLNK